MSADKIVYIGKEKEIDGRFMGEQLTLMNNTEIQWHSAPTVEEAMEHFFSSDHIVLLLVEHGLDDLATFIMDIKTDEVFQFLPIILMLPTVDPDTRKIYFNLGIEHFLELGCDHDELVMSCHSAIRYKIKIDSVMEKLRVVSEENITRSIQLDILKRYLPLTIWYNSEFLAEAQDYEIPEEEKELAILFADIKGFTTRSESMTPHEVIEMLNRVFDVATRAVDDFGGDIDKFIGDAILAVFPSASTALKAALRIQRELCAGGVYDDDNQVQLRIGIHFGKVIRGSVGGNQRWDLTLIGDTVNTAQRLESQAPAGGILISKAALVNAGIVDKPLFRFKSYSLKGKTQILEASAIVPKSLRKVR